MTQTMLFDRIDAAEPEPLPPYVAAPTSREAAESVRDHVSRLRRIVLDAIRGAGDRGMTCDEVEVATGLSHQTTSARICQLASPPEKATWPVLIVEARDAAGEVVKRKTRSGRRAAVWVAVNTEVNHER